MIRLMSDCLLRISEVVAVNVGDLKEKTLTVHASKSDQEGTGESLYVCDATRRVLERYGERVGITRSALFRHIRRGDHIQPTRLTPHSARRIIQKRAQDAGVEGFISGHSLRVGSAVSLAQAGASVVDMQVAGRWKSSQILRQPMVSDGFLVGILLIATFLCRPLTADGFRQICFVGASVFDRVFRLFAILTLAFFISS